MLKRILISIITLIIVSALMLYDTMFFIVSLSYYLILMLSHDDESYRTILTIFYIVTLAVILTRVI